MIRIAVDMDEVIADAFSAQLAWYQATHHYTLSRMACIGKPLSALVSPAHAEMMKALLVDGRFFETLPVMPGAERALRALSARFELFVTTAAMEYPNSCEYKFRWLRRHLPFIEPSNIVFCGDKSIVRADYLVDDNVRHFRRFSGQGLLFDAPHNAGVDWQPRITDWDAALRYFRERG
ncbi:5' nucleotidase, NT5C type [Burkholderia seminalis]|uniref:5' nucleotidase, NT5C type n=1 Tax=Burkholderia seminalis TaxID=488731 RepID=UPI00158E32CA|nr:hypothetical protein [Burkholderia seminalis]